MENQDLAEHKKAALIAAQDAPTCQIDLLAGFLATEDMQRETTLT
jgi:hypothetical protein